MEGVKWRFATGSDRISRIDQRIATLNDALKYGQAGLDFLIHALDDEYWFINLSEATLCWTNLSETNFRGANLSQANLVGAKFTSLDLSGADLSGAKLNGVNLEQANLEGAYYNEETDWPVGFRAYSQLIKR